MSAITVAAKVAAKMMTSKKGRKNLKTIALFIFSPFLILLLVTTGTAETTTNFNDVAIRVLFTGVPVKDSDFANTVEGRQYKVYITNFQNKFSEIDEAYYNLGNVEGEYDSLYMKEILFVAYFEGNGDAVANVDAQGFVNSFVETSSSVPKENENDNKDKDTTEPPIIATKLLNRSDGLDEALKFLKKSVTDKFVASVSTLDEAIIKVIQGEANDNGGGQIGSNDMNINVDIPSFNSPLNPFSNSGWTGQCTWYCWGRANQLLNITELPLGNARDWIAQAKALGYKCGQTPSKNSIVVWGGTLQHVAYVEAYDGTNITISEGNYSPSGVGLPQYATIEQAKQRLHQVTYSNFDALKNKQGSGGIFLGFIYLEE